MFDDAVAPCTLPKQDEAPEDGVDCENSGWGNTAQNGVNNPDELMVVVTPAMSQSECNDLWEGRINDGNICSGGDDKGPCNVRYFYLIINEFDFNRRDIHMSDIFS